MAGRRGKLDDEVQKKMVEALSAGNYMDTSCAYAGISTSTFSNWRRRGEAEERRLKKARTRTDPKPSEQPYLAFLAAIKKAEIQAEFRNVALINQAAKGGEEVKSKTTTTRTPVKENGRVLRDEDGNIVYTERTTTESTKAAPQWQASAWWLERTRPDKFGRQRLELTGKDGGPMESVGMSKDEYLELIKERRGRVEANMRGLQEEDL